MSAGGGDFERALRMCLAAHVGQVRHGTARGRRIGCGDAREHGATGQVAADLEQ